MVGGGERAGPGAGERRLVIVDGDLFHRIKKPCLFLG